MADAWTDAEKSNLLLQIIFQLKPEKGGINWDTIQLEGRTKKACQLLWGRYVTHHKQQVEGAGGTVGEAGTPPKPKPKPKPKAAPRKRKVKKEEEDEDDDDEDEPSPTKKPRARARKPKEDSVDVPQPNTLEEVNDLMFPMRDMKAKAEDSI